MTYEFMRDRWETTKPIRGRADDIRPIDVRRRDWEQIVRVPLLSGEYAYAAKLYNTNVVTYYPDGIVKLAIEGWATPLTAQFMTQWTPLHLYVNKFKNMLWVVLDEKRRVPIPNDGEVRIWFNEALGKWVNLDEKPLMQRVVNRKEMKAERDKVRGFMDYCKTMLNLCEGVIMKDTWDSLRSKHGLAFGFTDPQQRVLRGGWWNRWDKEDTRKAVEQAHVNLLAMMAVEHLDYWERMMYAIIETEIHDWKLSYHGKAEVSLNVVSNRVDALLKRLPNVYTAREVDGSCFRDNLII